jgi:drug/metabolite transporter (DMT)-like permease
MARARARHRATICRTAYNSAPLPPPKAVVDAVLTVAYAAIAAIGNALFAIGQRHSTATANGLLFVGLSACVAFALAIVCAPMFGPVDAGALIRGHWRSLLLSGAGLFLTYVGFNLLYGRFGTSPYVVYAALAIITTTVGVGFVYLREPVTPYHVVAVLLAGAAIVAFSIGQSKV